VDGPRAGDPTVTVNRAFEYRGSDEPQADGPTTRGPQNGAVLAAVRDDVRQTLRTGWLDPAIEAAAANPVFFTAAWSAIRPNVGKSFLLLARALRGQAVEAIRVASAPDLRKQLEAVLTDEDLRRIEEMVRASHLAAAKEQIVVHALARAARRDRIPGTGREEPPIRRGIPEWQRWIVAQAPDRSDGRVLDEAIRAFGVTVAPMSMRLLARWPDALALLWESAEPLVATESWRTGAVRLRRVVRSGVDTLPHPVDLQWSALKGRGITEDERLALADALTSLDRSMADQTLIAAFAWVAMGAPDIGLES
jgi:hypothetical protein